MIRSIVAEPYVTSTPENTDLFLFSPKSISLTHTLTRAALTSDLPISFAQDVFYRIFFDACWILTQISALDGAVVKGDAEVVTCLPQLGNGDPIGAADYPRFVIILPCRERERCKGKTKRQPLLQQLCTHTYIHTHTKPSNTNTSPATRPWPAGIFKSCQACFQNSSSKGSECLSKRVTHPGLLSAHAGNCWETVFTSPSKGSNDTVIMINSLDCLVLAQ